jgi:hypothetical protein
MGNIIKLNVRGQLFATTRATLCAQAVSCWLQNLTLNPSVLLLPTTKARWRSPKTFGYVLDYLHNGCWVVFDIPDDLVKADCAKAEYFGLIILKGAWDTLLLKLGNKEPPTLEKQFQMRRQ